MERPDRLQREPVLLAPMKELVTGPRVSQPSVPVPDGDQAVGGGRIDALVQVAQVSISVYL